MLLDVAIAVSLNTSAPDYFVPTEIDTREIAEEIFESYEEKRSILKTRKVIIPIEKRTDLVVKFKNEQFLSVVYYFDL